MLVGAYQGSCRMLQCGAVCCILLMIMLIVRKAKKMLQCIAIRFSVLLCVAASHNELQCAASL